MWKKDMQKRRRILLILLILSLMLPANAFAAAPTKTVKENGVTTYKASGVRLETINQMNKMAEASWTLPSPLEYMYKTGTYITLPSGKYKGIPYTQEDRNTPDISAIQTNINRALRGEIPVMGLSCGSAVVYATRYATGNSGTYMFGAELPYTSPYFFIDGMRDDEGWTKTINGINIQYRNNLTKVGNYGKVTNYATYLDTGSLISKLMSYGNYTNGTIYENVYAKIKPGDSLVRVNKDNTGHTMLVTRVKIEYTADGKVDPAASKVYVVDTIRPNVSVFTTGEYSSWRNEDTRNPETGAQNNCFSFNYLSSSATPFLPVTAWPDSSTYTVTYDLCGGSGSFPAQTKSSYMPVAIPSAVPSRTGYDFGGWKPETKDIGVIYKPGSAYYQEYSNTLKAVWNAHSGKIIFDANGGTNAPESVTQYYGKSLTLPKEVPVLRGYAFCGWATSRNAADGQYQAGESFKDYSRLEKGSGASLTLYAVWKKTVAEADISLSETERYYNHLNFRPEVTVNYLGKDLVEGKDYTLTYPSESIEEGSYTVKVEGMGEYSGTVKLPYKVIKHEQSISSISSKAKIMGAGSFSLRAKAKTKLTYKTSKSSVAKVSSRGRITLGNVGTATITMTAKSTDYYSKATKKIKISVCPKGTTMTALSSKNNIMTVKWNKQTNQTSGYQIRISTSSSMNDPIIVSVAGNTQTERNMAGFKKGKKYYVQVRTYKSISGQKYCSVWSPMKSVVIK